MGRQGTPIQVKVLRPSPMSVRGPATYFQPITYILYRGINSAKTGFPARAATVARSSSSFAAVRTPSPMRPSPGPVPATAPKPRTQGINEHMCGIGVFIERVRGLLTVKSINPNGPAGQVSPTYLFPGKFWSISPQENTVFYSEVQFGSFQGTISLQSTERKRRIWQCKR
jgi:hypothetical protein